LKIINKLNLGLLSACFLGLCFSASSAADLVKLRTNVQAEKHNVNVTFRRGALASIGVDASIINGFEARTSDFGGQELPLYLIFDKYVEEERGTELAEYQFRLEGVVKCKLVQKGTSPDLPSVGLSVLAQNCKIVSINH
jgi:hypothetical protein